MKVLYLIFALNLWCSLIYGFESYYFTTSAQNGDGVYSLLRRYNLDKEPCNFQKFYKLNNLTKDAGLKANREYVLPIMITKYNGRSIRSTIGIEDWDNAVKIKEYNEVILSKQLRQTNYIDSKILWVPHHLYGCQSSVKEPEILIAENREATPKSKSIITYPLFGDTHQEVVVSSNALKGKVYYIVSGHGGIDPGARCTDCAHTLCEDEYAYDVSLRMAKSLMEQGATVHVIVQDNDGIRDSKYLKCDQDEVCLDGKKVLPRQKDRLAQRTNHVNALYKKHKAKGVKEQYALFMHIDSNHEDKRMDVYFFHHEQSKTGKKLASTLQETMKSKYAHYQANRGYHGSVKCRGLYVVRNTLPPAVLVELGNIKNPSDQKRITLPGNRQALAEWLVDGLANFNP